MRNNYKSQENYMLRKLRETKNISRPQLAKMVGVSKETIKYWENEGISPSLKMDEWINLCTALDLRFSELPQYFSSTSTLVKNY